MRRALMEAQAAFDEDEIPVGAIIVCKDRIISRAHNLTEMLTDVTAHAEMQAITSGANMLGGKYLKDCTLYVTVEPCVMCAGALGWAQISRVVYGASDEKRGIQNMRPMHCILRRQLHRAYWKMSAAHSCRISFRERDNYLTSTTRYLLVLQKICGLVMRRVYCLLASRTNA